MHSTTSYDYNFLIWEYEDNLHFLRKDFKVNQLTLKAGVTFNYKIRKRSSISFYHDIGYIFNNNTYEEAHGFCYSISGIGVNFRIIQFQNNEEGKVKIRF